MSGPELLLLVPILVGLLGIIFPVFPGSLLVFAAIFAWSWQSASAVGWSVFAVASALIVGGMIVKYVVPGKRLKNHGVPNRTLLMGGLAGVVGFFMIPVVGFFVGFVLGVYAAETQRIGSSAAWASTIHALKAVGVSILIELVAALAATAVWLIAVVLT